MRAVLFLIVPTVVFTSCSKYQYFDLTSDKAEKNQKKEFVTEDGRCRIVYSFAGARGPVLLSIYNKTSTPLQVDWRKSALILGDSSISFFDREIKFSGEIERNRYGINQDVTGSFTQPEVLEFIPPKSTITKRTRFVAEKSMKLNPKDGEEIRIEKQQVRVFEFTKEQSPMAFRIYLTLLSGEDSFNIDNCFYAAEILETKAAPQSFGGNRADRFYIKQKTGFGKASTSVFAIALTGLLIAAL